MKKLKLQNALLAICLVLPIALKTSNEINAMNTKEETYSQASNDKDPTQQTETKTLTQAIEDYGVKNPAGDRLNYDDYTNLLSGYLKGDNKRYLAALIQTKTKTIPILRKENYTPRIYSEHMFKILYTIQPNKPQGDDKLANLDQNKQIYKKLNDIQNIDQKIEYDLTYEEKILKLLITSYHTHARNYEYIKKLTDLLDLYKKHTKIQEDEPHQPLMSLLEQAEEQLDLEEEQSIKYDHYAYLARIIEIIRDFIKEYKNKNKPKQRGEFYQLIDNDFGKSKELEPLSESQLIPLSQKQVNNDILKYLTLMIQAKY